jgi:hypothetical protein
MKAVMRTVLLGGLAMLALSLATAGVAAAATTPEFKPVPAKKKFKGTSGPLTMTGGKDVFICSKGTVTGEVTGGWDLGNVVQAFTGCKSSSNGTTFCPLHTEGAKEGEVVTKPLTGELGTVTTKEAPSGVGLLLNRESPKEWWEMAENACTVGSTWEGTVAAEVSVTGKRQTTNRLVFKPGSIKEIKLDSGKLAEPKFQWFGIGATFESTAEVSFEEALEVT